MDIRAIVKTKMYTIVTTTCEQRRIHFFNHRIYKNYYVIKPWHDIDAAEFFLKCHALPPHHETDYNLNIDWAFAIEYGNMESYFKEKYVDFIRAHVAIKSETEIPPPHNMLGDLGWYQIDDITNTAKWVDAFYIHLAEEHRKYTNPPGTVVQKTLF